MKLVTFTHDASTRIGVVHGDEVADLAASPGLPGDMIALLAGGADAMAAARRAAAGRTARLALAEVRLAAPVPRPPKFLAIGLNYADHVKESGMTPPPVPVFFNKQSTCVTGPYDPIHLPRVSPLLDYEGELAFVIGGSARRR
jgi:2-keto-4-pentenoate hydratase/2-oxohepta-3-ene-1,7-dioic acid hydratase in catechol pathway